MSKVKKIVTFGEVMMRLSPPGYAKFAQTNHLDMEFGGGEANVAIALAYLDMHAVHVTRFPDNILGRAGAQFLRRHWLDTTQIVYGDEKIGMYFLEKGAVHRSSRVVYDREQSAFSKITPDMVEWDAILRDADWLHWTAITPALSAGTAATCLKALQTANHLDVPVSVDLTYRKNLWQYGKTPQEVLPALVECCDVVIASKYDLDQIQGGPHDQNEGSFTEASARLMQDYPRVRKVADKERESINATQNNLKAMLWDGQKLLATKKLKISYIVDRVGTGDAFAAGLIYGLLTYATDQQALDFAIAACALKHTIEGDVNLVSCSDVEELVKGNMSGRIIR